MNCRPTRYQSTTAFPIKAHLPVREPQWIREREIHPLHDGPPYVHGAIHTRTAPTRHALVAHRMTTGHLDVESKATPRSREPLEGTVIQHRYLGHEVPTEEVAVTTVATGRRRRDRSMRYTDDVEDKPHDEDLCGRCAGVWQGLGVGS